MAFDEAAKEYLKARDTTDKDSPYVGDSAAINDMLADIAKKRKNV